MNVHHVHTSPPGGLARKMFSAAVRPYGTGRDRVSLVRFHTDGMIVEEIPTATAHPIEAVGITTVLSFVAAGEKGRIATRLRQLARPGRGEAVAAACAAIRMFGARDMA